MINTVVVGYGLAGRVFHCPLIARQAGLRLFGIVARAPEVRAEAERTWNVAGFASLDDALRSRETDLVVIATPHDTHADLAKKVLDAGKHCVVDKVMALSTAEADRMIAARDRAGKMLSVFHNRRWDSDFLTLRRVLEAGLLGTPVSFESAVVRYAPPRTWRGSRERAGSILHDWGAHLIDQALLLFPEEIEGFHARVTPAPWQGVDSGGHGSVTLEFAEGPVFRVETSRICRFDKPRWLVIGTEGCYEQYGVDPQEDALRAGALDQATVRPEHRPRLARAGAGAGAGGGRGGGGGGGGGGGERGRDDRTGEGVLGCLLREHCRSLAFRGVARGDCGIGPAGR